jgi:hypothetical protein
VFIDKGFPEIKVSKIHLKETYVQNKVFFLEIFRYFGKVCFKAQTLHSLWRTPLSHYDNPSGIFAVKYPSYFFAVNLFPVCFAAPGWLLDIQSCGLQPPT